MIGKVIISSFSRKDIFYSFTIILLFILIRFYIASLLPLNNFGTDPILLFSLLSTSASLSGFVGLILSFSNLLIILFLGHRYFNGQIGLMTALLYAISPWNIYFDLIGSTYILVEFGILLIVLSLYIRKERNRSGIFLFLLGDSLITYTSLLFWPFALASIILFFHQKHIKKKGMVLLLTMIVPLIFISFRNHQGLGNLIKNQITIFSDVGLINTVNNQRGELTLYGVGKVSKLIENKYIYLTEHFFFTVLKHFVPWIFFINEYKLIGKSFAPPIFLGFLVPFLIGLNIFLKNITKKLPFVILLFVTLLPSILDQKSPDFARLLPLSPLIFLSIGMGLDACANIKLFNKIRINLLIVILVAVQLLVFLGDSMIREGGRLV